MIRVKLILKVLFCLVIFTTIAWFIKEYWYSANAVLQLNVNTAKWTLSKVGKKQSPGTSLSVVGDDVAKVHLISRQAMNTARELWRLAKSQLTQRKEDKYLLRIFSHATSLLESRLIMMSEISGHSERRRARLLSLEKELQAKLQRLQNPPNCRTAKFIVAEFPPYCGFGCHAHHVTYVLSVGLALNRTLYINGDLWQDVFLPVTKCQLPTDPKNATWSQVILWPMARTIKSRYNPPSLPENLKLVLVNLHSDPYAWFRGQLLRFVLKVSDTNLRAHLETEHAKLHEPSDANNFTWPVAGIHIRRSDKIYFKEAEFHSLSEYMEPVERFFDGKLMEYELKTGKGDIPPWIQRKRVFLASDDASVFEEAKRKYPNYEFFGDPHRATSAHDHSTTALWGIVTDFRLLASTSFLACTMTSNVCRMAYEWRLASANCVDVEIPWGTESVDSIYFNIGEKTRWWSAVASFPEVNISFGDKFPIENNMRNGFLKLKSPDVNMPGYVPAYLFSEESAVGYSDFN